MNQFNNLLQKIRQRPALYLGQNSIHSLQAFLDGYYFARRELDIPLTEQEKALKIFLQWLRQKMNCPAASSGVSNFQSFLITLTPQGAGNVPVTGFNVETGQTWASIVLFHASDERSAVERFFSLFDEFQQLQRPLMHPHDQLEAGKIAS